MTKNRRAAWFERNHRRAGFDVLRKHIQNFLEPSLCPIEHSVIVKRSSAAEIDPRNGHFKTGIFDYFHRRFCRFRVKEIVECVRP